MATENNQQKQPVKGIVEPLDEHPITDVKKPHTLGLLTIGLIFGLFGLWAVFVQIDTTVQAGGKIISKGYTKQVVHPRGGLVKKILVKEGDYVEEGEPLIELDSTSVESDLNSNISKHDALLARSVRLRAEANLNANPDFSKIESQFIDKNNSINLIKREKELLASDLKSLNLQISMLKSKNEILNEQISGLKSRIESNQKILETYKKELAKWQSLYERNMTDELKLFDRQRRIDQIEADINDAKSKIQENLKTIEANKNQIALQKAQFEDKARNELKDVLLNIEILKNTIISLRNQKKNLTLTAPGEGVVSNMIIHAAGEVVPPQKPVATIVPKKHKFIAELMIQPTDIDKVHVGQKADIHFPSYVDPAAKPIEGNVTYVSADTFTPQGAKMGYYKVLVEITPKGMEAIKENGFDIIPSMPVSAYIKAGKRSFLSYFLLPLESLMKGAFHAN